MLPASHCVLAGRGRPKPVARDYAWRGHRLRLGEVLRGFREAALECGAQSARVVVRDRRN